MQYSKYGNGGVVMKNRQREAGILMPIFSLAGEYGIGSFGKEARDFVDLLQETGNRIWQILPMGPTGFGDSPYQSFSTFAGNPYFIDLPTLKEEGLKVEQFIRFSSKASIEDIMTPIHSVKKIESRENFISEIKEDLEHLLKECKEKVDKQEKSFEEERQNGYDISDDLEEEFILLYKDCDAAKQIPRWETHLFSSNRYEMSKEEYDQLSELLDIIAEERPKIIDYKIDNLIENAEKVQEAYSMLCKMKLTWQNINDCLEQYKKITKVL